MGRLRVGDDFSFTTEMCMKASSRQIRFTARVSTYEQTGQSMSVIGRTGCKMGLERRHGLMGQSSKASL